MENSEVGGKELMIWIRLSYKFSGTDPKFWVVWFASRGLNNEESLGFVPFVIGENGWDSTAYTFGSLSANMY